MPKIYKTSLVPFSAMQMYNLVNDIKSYPLFLPGCVASELILETESSMIASMDVAKAGIRKHFVTRNQLTPGKTITLTLEKGPFKHLNGCWNFTEITSDACKLEFNLDFEFKSPVASLVFGSIFKELMNGIVHAFIQRAKVVYAKK